MSKTEQESLLLYYLAKFAGQAIPYWEVVNKIGDVVAGHNPPQQCIPKKERRKCRASLASLLSLLVREKKVIRYQQSHKNLVRINEALIPKSRSINR